MVKQLVAMGYTQTQAEEALWASGYRGVAEALEILLTQ